MWQEEQAPRYSRGLPRKGLGGGVPIIHRLQLIYILHILALVDSYVKCNILVCLGSARRTGRHEIRRRQFREVQNQHESTQCFWRHRWEELLH